MALPPASNRSVEPSSSRASLRPTLIGWGARFTMMILAFYNVQLIIELTGREGLAAYSVVVSLTPWLALLNLGLPLTIQNEVARRRAAGESTDEAKHDAVNAALMLVATLLPLSVVLGVLARHALLANYDFASAPAVAAACCCLALAGHSLVLSHLLLADHRPTWHNVYPAIHALFACGALLLLRHRGMPDFNEVLVLVHLGPALTLLHALWLLRNHWRWRWQPARTFALARASRAHLLFACLASCVLAIDYIVMSRVLAASAIADYALASRLFLAILALHAVMLSTNWSPLAELTRAGRLTEARQRTRRLLMQSFALALVLGLPMVVFANDLVRIWTGAQVQSLPRSLVVAWLLYVLIRVWSDTYGIGVLGAGGVKHVNMYLPIQASIGVTAQWVLGSHWGPAGIVLGMALSYLLVAAWINPRIFSRLLKEAHDRRA